MTATTPLYPTKAIAKLLNLTDRRVQQLAKEGVIPKATRGRFDLTAAVQGYVKYLQDRAIGQTAETEQVNDSRIRMAAAKATKAEIETGIMQGEYLPKADVILALQQYTTIIATQMDAQAGRLADEVAAEPNPGKCRQIILKEHRRTRDSAADKLKCLGGVPRSGGRAKATTRKKHGSVGGSKSNTTKRKRRARPVPKQ